VDDAFESISDFHRARARVQAAESFDKMLSSSELAVANAVILDHEVSLPFPGSELRCNHFQTYQYSSYKYFKKAGSQLSLRTIPELLTTSFYASAAAAYESISLAIIEGINSLHTISFKTAAISSAIANRHSLHSSRVILFSLLSSALLYAPKAMVSLCKLLVGVAALLTVTPSDHVNSTSHVSHSMKHSMILPMHPVNQMVCECYSDNGALSL